MVGKAWILTINSSYCLLLLNPFKLTQHIFNNTGFLLANCQIYAQENYSFRKVDDCAPSVERKLDSNKKIKNDPPKSIVKNKYNSVFTYSHIDIAVFVKANLAIIENFNKNC